VVNSIGIEKDCTCNRKHSAELSLLLNMTILAIETKTKRTPHAIDCAKMIPIICWTQSNHLMMILLFFGIYGINYQMIFF